MERTQNLIPSKSDRDAIRLRPEITQETVLLLDAVDAMETLLTKYIDHVGYEEGVTFIYDEPEGPSRFSDAEWQFLRDIDNATR